MSTIARSMYLLIVALSLSAAVTEIAFHEQVAACSTLVITLLGLAIGAIIAGTRQPPVFVLVWLLACMWAVLAIIPWVLLVPGRTFETAGLYWPYWALPAFCSVLAVPLLRLGWEHVVWRIIQPSA